MWLIRKVYTGACGLVLIVKVAFGRLSEY